MHADAPPRRRSPSYFTSFSQLFVRSAHGPFQPVCYVPGYAHIITPVYTRKFSSTRRSDNHFCRAAEGIFYAAIGTARRGAARCATSHVSARLHLSADERSRKYLYIQDPLVPPRLSLSTFALHVSHSFAHNVALLLSFLAASLFHGRSIR